MNLPDEATEIPTLPKFTRIEFYKAHWKSRMGITYKQMYIDRAYKIDHCLRTEINKKNYKIGQCPESMLTEASQQAGNRLTIINDEYP